MLFRYIITFGIMNLREIVVITNFPKLKDLVFDKLSVAIDSNTNSSYENLFDFSYIWF